MREASNCLNVFFLLIALPLYLLVLPATFIGYMLGRLASNWLPEWAQFISTPTFLGVALGLVVWYVIVLLIQSARMHNSMDFSAMEAVFYMFEDGLSGFLLILGALVAAVILKLTIL